MTMTTTTTTTSSIDVSSTVATKTEPPIANAKTTAALLDAVTDSPSTDVARPDWANEFIDALPAAHAVAKLAVASPKANQAEDEKTNDSDKQNAANRE